MALAHREVDIALRAIEPLAAMVGMAIYANSVGGGSLSARVARDIQC